MKKGSDSSASCSACLASYTTAFWSIFSDLTLTLSARYSSGSEYLKLRSSSSFWMLYRPRRLARGAKMVSVSVAIFFCLWGGMCSSVLMLCSLSASLTMMILISFVMAMKSCCMSTCFLSSFPPNAPLFSLSLVTLVSPSTMCRTPSPKIDSMSAKETLSVSSTTSCNNPATMESASIFNSPKIWATATGWMMYGSPDLRFWPLWAPYAICSPC